jgi:HD-GYP domain-containing protein (c-di-GMP phosphodiesterase class II)
MDEATELPTEVLEIFADALHRFDADLGAHSARVGTNAVSLGRAVGVTERELEALRWAGRLHDLGRLGVPAEVLHKTSPLGPLEWAAVERHPDVGADLLLTIAPELTDVAGALRGHHERWDGAGYPARTGGVEIALLARILAVVDVFDALIQPRAYRVTEFTIPEAVLHLGEGRGTRFDPELVDAFLQLLEDGLVVTSPPRAVPADPDATLELLRRQLNDMVALRATGQWTASDENHYARLAEHEAMLLGRRTA